MIDQAKPPGSGSKSNPRNLYLKSRIPNLELNCPILASEHDQPQEIRASSTGASRSGVEVQVNSDYSVTARSNYSNRGTALSQIRTNSLRQQKSLVHIHQRYFNPDLRCEDVASRDRQAITRRTYKVAGFARSRTENSEERSGVSIRELKEDSSGVRVFKEVLPSSTASSQKARILKKFARITADRNTFLSQRKNNLDSSQFIKRLKIESDNPSIPIASQDSKSGVNNSLLLSSYLKSISKNKAVQGEPLKKEQELSALNDFIKRYVLLAMENSRMRKALEEQTQIHLSRYEDIDGESFKKSPSKSEEQSEEMILLKKENSRLWSEKSSLIEEVLLLKAIIKKNSNQQPQMKEVSHTLAQTDELVDDLKLFEIERQRQLSIREELELTCKSQEKEIEKLSEKVESLRVGIKLHDHIVSDSSAQLNEARKQIKSLKQIQSTLQAEWEERAQKLENDTLKMKKKMQEVNEESNEIKATLEELINQRKQDINSLGRQEQEIESLMGSNSKQNEAIIQLQHQLRICIQENEDYKEELQLKTLQIREFEMKQFSSDNIIEKELLEFSALFSVSQASLANEKPGTVSYCSHLIKLISAKISSIINVKDEDIDLINNKYLDLLHSHSSLKKDYNLLLAESQKMVEKWLEEVDKVKQENVDLDAVVCEKTQEIDRAYEEKGKLLIRIAMAYSEIERLSLGRIN